jgi:bacterial/archaeal transporter family-2 protein
MNWILILIAFLIGTAIAAQPSINQASAQVLGAPASAAVISVSITMALMLGYLVAAGVKIEPTAVARLPWWIALGGLAGFVIVLGGITVIPIIGAAVFFVCIVAGQLAGAALIDHFGAFSMPVRPINPMRLVGLVLALSGVGLIVIGSR